MPILRRRQFLSAGLAVPVAAPLSAALAAPALARQRQVWTLVTSWARNQPGPGTSAQRLADRITQGSNGLLSVELSAAGELVAAFDVLTAVASGTAQMAHSAALFWTDSLPAAYHFSAVPFGMGPRASQAWLAHGGGQALWDQLYADFAIKPFLAGNSGPTLAGWFRAPIQSLADLRGRRLRAVGLGGEIYRRLGASTLALPPADLLQALDSGAIDGAEFLGPFSDRALGLDQVAPYGYQPGFNKPNGGAEALIAQSAWQALPPDLQSLVQSACEAESLAGLAEADALNAAALQAMQAEGAQPLAPLPEDLITAARQSAQELRAELAAGDALHERIRASYDRFAERMTGWIG